MNLSVLFSELKDECQNVERILPPVKVIQFFSDKFDQTPHFFREVGGRDNSGREILSYTFGEGGQVLGL